MHLRRHRTLLRAAALALVAVLFAGCSDGAAEVREQANEQVESLGDSLAEAVVLSYQASQGRVEPNAGIRAVGDAQVTILALNETAASLDATAQALVLEMTDLANQALQWISQTEYERAEKLRLEEFIPVASEFSALPLDPDAEPVEASSSPSWSTGRAIFLLATIAGIGLLVAARYRRGDVPDPIEMARKRKAERSGATTEPKQRTWSEIPTLFAPDEQSGPQPSDDPDANRTTKARSMAVDLRALLMTALHQVKDYGWEMSIVSPELHINADPVKLRHAVVAALGNAFLGGAQRVGIVVEDIEGEVLLTIGRDAPPEQQDAEDFAERFTTQVTLALGLDRTESSLINDDDVSLMSVSLGRKVDAPDAAPAPRAPDASEPAPAPASEPATSA